MIQPAYLSVENTRCDARKFRGNCGQIVRSGGITICEHTTLRHKSKNKTITICRRCLNNARLMGRLIGRAGNYSVFSVEMVKNKF